MSARCEHTELPVDMCSHCLGHDQRERAERQLPAAPLGPAVEARYPGQCATCGGHYPAGTTIRRSPDGWTADCCLQET
ncbi:hypothetical protein ABH931_006125 [Streptacidiphilus sp. MAP12-33]|uniref:hypothetical protein n=1 Tax=Streptacidiphilus sp. MAP12-33 TaxID=3156266 RepID=UPI0035148BB5